MAGYIRREESIGYKFGNDYKGILAAIGNRFIGCNPAEPFLFRTFHTGGILCDPFGQSVFDFDERFGDCPGEFAYAFGKLWSETARTSSFTIECKGSVKVYVNKLPVFDSKDPIFDGAGGKMAGKEGAKPDKLSFPVYLDRGWNAFFLRFERTDAGFGCLFGNAMPQWEPCNFHAPFFEREGKAGFVFTGPLEEKVFGNDNIPDLGTSEESTGLEWLPDGTWPLYLANIPAACRVFQDIREGVIYAWTSIVVKSQELCKIELRGEALSGFRIWISGDEIWHGKGTFVVEKELGYGKYDILAACSHSSGELADRLQNKGSHAGEAVLEEDLPDYGQWGFRLEAYQDGKQLDFVMPRDIKGCSDAWLYLGPFGESAVEDIGVLTDLHKVFENNGREIYWRIDEKDTVIRPFVENALYGRWTYPLGVTLYGLLRYGEVSGNSEIQDYVRDHVSMVTKIHEYALYDKRQYGFPGVNHQIAWLDALDDCGSFGSLMLECNSRWKDPAAERVAEMIADHMKNRQIRREDGAFYRGNDTMWADDLYMSVPFLRRYWQLTGKEEYLDEACKQILLFEKYLFMENLDTMSHIYSFTHDRPTDIPWGRGNGWVIFSISELLEVLPMEHRDYGKITDLYNRLLNGYIALQGKNGLWHQVLNRTDTYEEASCTAMFVCAFVRGIIKGYLHRDLKGRAVQSVFKAWEGLVSRTVDYQGNIYGVCRGSGFSFSSDYYKELSWNFNDTHGIGIIILAGTEIMRLETHLKENSGSC